MYLGELRGMSMSKLLFYCNRKAITCTEFEKWSIHPVRLVYLIYSRWQLVSVEIPDQWELFSSWNKKRRQSGPCWPLKENKEKSHWFRSSISELIFFFIISCSRPYRFFTKSKLYKLCKISNIVSKLHKFNICTLILSCVRSPVLTQSHGDWVRRKRTLWTRILWLINTFSLIYTLTSNG